MKKNPDIYYTGVSATAAEESSMRQPLPYLVIGGSVTESSQEQIHRIALSHGLRDIRGYYGYDFEEHEFICLIDSLAGEPDQFPSRRLRDILA